ncbi:TPA: transposase [Mannheimia haemolytica]
MFDPKKHHRRSIRLKGYDYSQEGLYFLTICCKNRECLFGEIINQDIKLNRLGQMVYREWLNTKNIRNNIELLNFVIMPNHLHAIIQIIQKKGTSEDLGKFKSPKQTIGSIVRGFKISVIKQLKDEYRRGELQFAPTNALYAMDFNIWQRNYYEHIIRNEKSFDEIVNYIQNNPLNWERDCFYI